MTEAPDTPEEGLSREEALRPGRAWLAMILSTALFGAALWQRDTVWVWWASGVAGALSLALAFWAHPRCLAGLVVPDRSKVVEGLVSAVAMAAATYLAWWSARGLFPDLVSEAVGLYSVLDSPPGRVAAVPIVALVVAAEEVVWRGLGVELMSRPGRSRAAIWALAVGLYVVPQIVGGSPVLILLAASAGGVWTAQRIRGATVVTPFLTHLVWDVIVFVLVPLDRLGG